MEFKTLEDLLDYMRKIVEKKLIAYKSDFYEYDVSILKNNDIYDRFCYVWMLRDTGTWFTESATFMAMYLNTEPHDIYRVQKDEDGYSITYYGKYGRL